MDWRHAAETGTGDKVWRTPSCRPWGAAIPSPLPPKAAPSAPAAHAAGRRRHPRGQQHRRAVIRHGRTVDGGWPWQDAAGATTARRPVARRRATARHPAARTSTSAHRPPAPMRGGAAGPSASPAERADQPTRRLARPAVTGRRDPHGGTATAACRATTPPTPPPPRFPPYSAGMRRRVAGCRGHRRPRGSWRPRSGGGPAGGTDARAATRSRVPPLPRRMCAGAAASRAPPQRSTVRRAPRRRGWRSCCCGGGESRAGAAARAATAAAAAVAEVAVATGADRSSRVGEHVVETLGGACRCGCSGVSGPAGTAGSGRSRAAGGGGAGAAPLRALGRRQPEGGKRSVGGRKRDGGRVEARNETSKRGGLSGWSWKTAAVGDVAGRPASRFTEAPS